MDMRLTTRSKEVSKGAPTFWESLYFPAIFKGMLITLGHLFKRKVTVKYPEHKRSFSPVFRGLHILNRDERGRERCTACGLCALACPAEAITMDAAERTESEKYLYREEKYAARYEINMLRCIFCGLCEDACPKDAIYLTETMPPSNFTRESFIYGKKDLLIPHPIHEPKAFQDVTKKRIELKK